MSENSINHHKSSLSIFLRCQNACTGAIYQGYTLTEMLFAGNHILIYYGFDIFSIDDGKKYVGYDIRLMDILIGPIMCITGLITTYFTPFFTSKFERRQCMIVSDIIFIIAAILTQLPAWYSFMIGRLLMGITCGIDLGAVPLYIREISPDHMGEIVGSLFQANIYLGAIFGFLLALPLDQIIENNQDIGINWRWVFIFPVIFSIIRLVGMVFFYKLDTPFYYYRSGQNKKGRLALAEIYLDQYVDMMEQQQLKSNSIDVTCKQQLQKEAARQKNQANEGNQNYHATSNNEENTINHIWHKKITQKEKKSYFNRLRIGLVINFLQQMSGCTALIGLSPLIIEQITENYESLRCIILGSYIFLFFVSTLGAGFNRKLARKQFLLGGFLIMSILQFSLGVISYHSSALKESRTVQFVFLLFIFLIYATYSFTVGPVTIILTSDILKDRGFCFSFMMNWLGAFVSIILLVIPKSYIYHFIYGSCAFLGFLFSMNYIVETKWLSFHDVQDLYQDDSEIENIIQKDNFTTNDQLISVKKLELTGIQQS